jgi:hypothetical protein
MGDHTNEQEIVIGGEHSTLYLCRDHREKAEAGKGATSIIHARLPARRPWHTRGDVIQQRLSLPR